ncbi:hypothetical protein HAX54_000672 [Datura stramonium]|uniref:Uncharacterized protein n=1 Tax=Datura stramonium TaxID=4076 RepID=A0ABS8T2G3_DATST|nr:hypothetical protein [Datura stramonium]
MVVRFTTVSRRSVGEEKRKCSEGVVRVCAALVVVRSEEDEWSRIGCDCFFTSGFCRRLLCWVVRNCGSGVVTVCGGLGYDDREKMIDEEEERMSSGYCFTGGGRRWRLGEKNRERGGAAALR